MLKNKNTISALIQRACGLGLWDEGQRLQLVKLALLTPAV
jgi:hypothetical protein